jgi:hypothetical protein
MDKQRKTAQTPIKITKIKPCKTTPTWTKT